MTFHYRKIYQTHTLQQKAPEAYLIHSDPRKKLKRSDTYGSPKAHRSTASINTKYAQHVHPTAQGMQKIRIKKGPEIRQAKVQEYIRVRVSSKGVVQGQPQQSITMVSRRRDVYLHPGGFHSTDVDGGPFYLIMRHANIVP